MMSASGGDGLGGHAGAAGGKSDTSSRGGPVPFKNPLLSMQVTGLTLDDFAHNAMLLPAAPAPMLEVSREPETTDRHHKS
ncbi:hypothetical protein pipiens_002232 [Culex pipiens pipiens]|uniref:Uncharacterized protein n=1 Tax=Culex pipiens pipiens TaxID=38569 RepID=A0ABD1DJU1_CULPP